MAGESTAVPNTGSDHETAREPLLGQDGETAGKEVEGAAGVHKVRNLIQSLRETVGNGVGKVVERAKAQKVQDLVQSTAENGMSPHLHMLLIGLVVTLGILSALMGILAEAFNNVQKYNMLQRWTLDSCYDYPGTTIIVFGILGSVFAVAAVVLATVAGYWVTFTTSDTTKDKKFSSLEIVAGSTQRKAFLLLLRSRIDLILCDSSSVLFSIIFCLLAVHSFLSGSQARYTIHNMMRRSTYCDAFVSPFVFIGAATCAFISVSTSLAFYLQTCENYAKVVADSAISNEAPVKGTFAKEKSTYVGV